MSFGTVLIIYVVVLFVINRLLSLRKPKIKTTKMHISRNGKVVVVDAIMLSQTKVKSDSDDVWIGGTPLSEQKMDKGYIESITNPAHPMYKAMHNIRD